MKVTGRINEDSIRINEIAERGNFANWIRKTTNSLTVVGELKIVVRIAKNGS